MRAGRAICLAAVLVLAPVSMAAQDLDRGLAALRAGDYLTAAGEFEQGNAAAQNTHGYMYENGLGIPQDHAEAVRWYRRAAEQGHARAQNNLGAMYAGGLGVPQDYVEAHMWLKLAQANRLTEGRELRALPQAETARSDIPEAQRRARLRFDSGHFDSGYRDCGR